MKATQGDGRAGFSLPLVMMVMGGLVVMALALMGTTGLTRHGTRAAGDAQRAECAARAALEACCGMLERETANDDFLVIGESGNEADQAMRLFLTNAEVSGAFLKFRHAPLFSVRQVPDETERLACPVLEPWLDGPEVKLRPWLKPVRPQWLELHNAKGEVTARYAWWAEDLQGKLNARVAGNQDGPERTHVRARWPFPAAGLNPNDASGSQPALDGIALYVLDEDASARDTSDLDNRVIEGRKWLTSPQSLLAASGFQAPLRRDAAGHLADPRARALEEHVASGWCAYDELPTVPCVAGIERDVMTKPKLNLNGLLAKRRPSAVVEMASWMERGLPRFVTRQGGFPDDYLKTLAANALDYADDDGDASTDRGSYRGVDSYPFVSEFLMRFRWENVETVAGRKIVTLSASTYVELWNMCDQPVEGSAQVSYETRYRFALGANPEVNLNDAALLDDPEICTPHLSLRDGKRWFPSFQVNLRPNEMRVYRVGTVSYRLDAGLAAVYVPSPLTLDDDNAASGYALEWNGKRVDGARGRVNRNSASLHYPSDTLNKPRQKVRATIPGLSYKRAAVSHDNNMGDPRMAFYLAAPQDANTYPGNYSPNRRTVRWETIYSLDRADKPKVHGRVLPSEWPDGGHDAAYGSNDFMTTDPRVMPDDPRFFEGLVEPKAEHAPMRISNRGRFFSATELGRVFDPMMWKTRGPAAAGEPWPQVMPGQPASDTYGGGNTLCIGRPEHPRFEAPGLQAVRLLDLFHTGKSRSEDAVLRQGALVRIDGHVNLNTASRDVLRSMAAGLLGMDPALAEQTSRQHDTDSLMAPPTRPLELSAPSREMEADVIADAILRGRPYGSASEIARARDEEARWVFGNRQQYAQDERIQWSDSAAEEVFARVYDAATVRSRNFRIHAVGQALSPAGGVLAESRKVFTVFADPVRRAADGKLERTRVRVIYENDG